MRPLPNLASITSPAGVTSNGEYAPMCVDELALERRRREEAERVIAEMRARLAEVAESERYFRHMVENALELVTILNADGSIRFESESIKKELGHPPEEYIGRSAFEFVHPEDLPRVRQAFAEALEKSASTPPLSFRFLHKDGSYRILEGRGNNLLHDQAVRGIVFNSRDVTEQRRLEEQLRQSQKVQAIGQLTGGVAHDFNNILTAIIGYSDLLLASMPTGSERLHVSEIRKAAMRAAGLTRQLLAFSRKQVLQPRVMSLSGTVVEMDKMLRRLLGEQIDIVYSIAADAGNVKADHGQIEQVILNLAVNARDAMAGVENPQLTICVENATLEDLYVSQRADVVPGDYVELSVSDNGSGMPPTVLSRLFEPFFTTKPQGQGTGLGLATCHGIVKQSGGHIAAYSEVGCGTTFKVYLPRVMERLDERTRENDVEFVPSGHAKILFAEDEPMLRELGTVVLEELGYTVVTAENGVEALKLFRENSGSSFDLLVTDVVMPQMGGRELAEALWQIENHLRVIFCSGYTEDAIIRSGGLDESAHFLQKPYSVAAIAQKVSEVLQLPVRRTVARTSADS